MASRSSLRQVSQVIRNNRLHLQPSRTQHYSSQSLFRAPVSFRLRSLPSRSSIHLVQHTRNLSLWGSSSPKPASPADAVPTSNVNTLEPSQFESLRTVKANNTNSDLSHAPNTLEPEFLEDAQQAIAQPHGVEPPSIPLEQIPERIGYLYEVCGLDFGLGPSSMMQWIFEHIHIWGGLSWTTSIVVMGLGIRALVVPFIIESARQGATLKLMSAAVKPIQERLTEAKKRNDMVKVQEHTLELRAVSKSYGVKWLRLVAPMAIQFPLGFAAWRNLRNCATLPVPGFVTESWLWNVDLTFSDQWLIFPGASALLIWASLNVNTKVATATGTGMANADAMKVLKSVLPVVSFAFMVFQPGAVQIYFLCSSVMGFLTTYFMSTNVVRRMFGLVTVEKGAPNSAASNEVDPFMRRRQIDILDVPAREVSSRTAARDQNVSAIDKWATSAKKTLKGATESISGTWSSNKEQAKKKGSEQDAMRRLVEQEEERRRLNQRRGTQAEKESKY